MNIIENFENFSTRVAFLDLVKSKHSSIFIQGNPGHGYGPAIPISIGNVQWIGTLDNNNFPSLCQVINEITLTPLYPDGQSRDNHNGTHSSRQARMLEVWFDLMERGRGKDLLASLTEEEKIHLKLAAYLLRSGRIDESSHHDPNPDDYYTRSALIYEAYANQLKASKETIFWVKNLIVNSCKPKGVRDAGIDLDLKSKFAWDALSIVHELDLIRCYSKNRIHTSQKPTVKAMLLSYFDETEAKEILDPLFEFSKGLCKATGCYRIYDHDPGDPRLFMLCSTDGKTCWEAVKNTTFIG